MRYAEGLSLEGTYHVSRLLLLPLLVKISFHNAKPSPVSQGWISCSKPSDFSLLSQDHNAELALMMYSTEPSDSSLHSQDLNAAPALMYKQSCTNFVEHVFISLSRPEYGYCSSEVVERRRQGIKTKRWIFIFTYKHLSFDTYLALSLPWFTTSSTILWSPVIPVLPDLRYYCNIQWGYPLTLQHPFMTSSTIYKYIAARASHQNRNPTRHLSIDNAAISLLSIKNKWYAARTSPYHTTNL
jgi:hypothetical protein